MAKKPTETKGQRPLLGAFQMLLAGCAAEIYVLLLRRYYVYGTLDQILAWDNALPYVLYGGLAAAIIGLILLFVWKSAGGWKRVGSGWLMGIGLFLIVSTLLAQKVYMTGITLLSIAVPVVAALGILWFLYDRMCFYALSILGVSTLAAWICRHGAGNAYWKAYVIGGAVVLMALLGLIAWITWKAEQADGLLGKRRIFPAGMDATPIYIACGLSAIAVLVSLFGAAAAYYAIWGLIIVIFIMIVYYTVKQL